MVNIPEGISIIDGSGNIIPAANYSEWNEDLGLTGIGVNSQGHKLVFGVADSWRSSHEDDMTINTYKYWSQALYGVNVPGLTETTLSSVALQDFNSKANTDAILEALATSSNPSETNNAAIVCRNYSAGIIGQGLWDLPAAGTLDIIGDLHSELDTLIRVNMGKSYYEHFSPIGGYNRYTWTSTEYSSNESWYLNLNSSYPKFMYKRGSLRIVPVYTIE